MSGLTWILLIVVALVVLGTGVTSRCYAETSTTSERCRNIRPGPFRRCQHHTNDLWVPRDFICVGLWAVAVVVAYIWFVQGGLPVAIHDAARALRWLVDRLVEGMPA